MVNEISMMTIFVVSLCDKNKAEVWIKHLNNPLKQGNSFQTRNQYQSYYSDLSALPMTNYNRQLKAPITTQASFVQPSIIPGKHVRTARPRFWLGKNLMLQFFQQLHVNRIQWCRHRKNKHATTKTVFIPHASHLTIHQSVPFPGLERDKRNDCEEFLIPNLSR